MPEITCIVEMPLNHAMDAQVMTCKTQGGEGTPNRRAEAPVDRVSDGKEGGDLISPDHNRTSPILELETMGAGGSGGAWVVRVCVWAGGGVCSQKIERSAK